MVKPGPDDFLKGAFVRQRRNLLIVSLVLLYAQISNLTIDKLNFLGNEIKLGRPESVFLALWVGWAYWLYRYFSYFHDLGSKGIKDTYEEYIKNRIRIKREYFLQATPEFHNQLPRGAAVITTKSVSPDVRFHRKTGMQVAYEMIELQYMQPDGNRASTNIKNLQVNITPAQLFATKIRSIFYVVIKTRYFSEYLLPFAVGFSPVISAAVLSLLRLKTNAA